MGKKLVNEHFSSSVFVNEINTTCMNGSCERRISGSSTLITYFSILMNWALVYDYDLGDSRNCYCLKLNCDVFVQVYIIFTVGPQLLYF